MNVYVHKDDIPDKCIECSFLDGADECFLQDADTNFNADSFDDLLRTCPLLSVESLQTLNCEEKEELRFTRDFVSRHGLMWALKNEWEKYRGALEN